ncbi:L-glutamate gamma-semialdehyde dehydrogenase [Guptibacillus spartinae]|uniref:L-glutamate gamma-semialdehyde dehydrogenase n=1 Tax=Guptibacillus spartinae TaxID=3025679 RepID=UPI0023624AC6|nr:L-glutamate gamma-semialdehyde dehydrogenase [Pseudalkalibacillus spartinae]
MKNIYTFENEPFVNFKNPKNKTEIEAQLNDVQSKLGKQYPLVINGERIKTERVIESLNPGKKDEVVGYVSAAGTKEAERALNVASETFKTWSKVPAKERVHYLFEASRIMRERKHEFTAWMVFESGKNWLEADADTAEAIDFMEYYARQMLDLANPEPLIQINPNVDPDMYRPLPAEDNKLEYIPLGVGVVIPPWNFPLAILAGTVTSAIVTGNTVILKPSELTSVIGYKFVELMEEVGLPKGVLNFLPGYGSEIGDYLVDSPKTRFISFTGSRATGTRIYERAAKVQPGQRWLKTVVAEMGGKDGVVVDETADLDQAAKDIVSSAFGFQGQKCSAGSRAIIVESVYDEVAAKVVDEAKKLVMGPGKDNFEMGPVSDQKSFDKVMGYIEVGKKEAELLLGGEAGSDEGYYIEPTIFGNVVETDRIFQEEIFGPVLGLTKAKDYKDAIRQYNNTEYGLTGAFHSTVEERIEEALEDMQCGNLYINKKCTGALVGVHPFGGYNMSGTDSKAGGPDYLLYFTQPKMKTRKLSNLS